jgi:hypothetical protein
MDVRHLSIARVLELGVPITWQDTAAIVYEAAALADVGDGRPGDGQLDAWIVTRGGEVRLAEQVGAVPISAVAPLAARLLAAAAARGPLGAALEAGDVLTFLDTYGADVSFRRRRVLIAGVALNALALEAQRQFEPETPSERTRRFARQTPRRELQDVPRPRRTPAPPARRLGVSARVLVWTAVAVSAAAAGFGAWRSPAPSPLGITPNSSVVAELPDSRHTGPAGDPSPDQSSAGSTAPAPSMDVQP